MKWAVLSDIHANLEALQAVLDDVRQQDAEKILCLGDVIGYGPNPRECLDLARQFDFCIMGNHDQGALFDPEGFSSGAERAIFWTRGELERVEDADPDYGENVKRWGFLGDLPRIARDNGITFVHGSPRNPLNEYVFPEDVFNQRKISRVFELVDRVCFMGHTHVPGVFTEDGRFLTPREIGGKYVLDGGKVMINVGSVGQPRDGDCRACYVLLQDNVVEFRRVVYPLEKTIEKIYAQSDLDNFLGDRLREGR